MVSIVVMESAAVQTIALHLAVFARHSLTA